MSNFEKTKQRKTTARVYYFSLKLQGCYPFNPFLLECLSTGGAITRLFNDKFRDRNPADFFADDFFADFFKTL